MNEMRLRQSPGEMFTLLNAERVRLQLPVLAVAGLSEPLLIHLDFYAASIDETLDRLTVLRSQMPPAPQRN